MSPRLPGKLLQLSSSLWAAQSTLSRVPVRSFGIKSLNEVKPSRFNVGPGLPVLESTTTAALRRKANSLPLRSGAIATKKGMTAIYDTETGKRTPCTVLQLDRVEVVSHKTRQKHGYFAVQQHDKITPWSLFCQRTLPKRHVFEFRVKDESGLLPVGESIQANWFQEGQYIDARSNTKGKGFAGVMKRHGFHGQDRSHGVSLTHRSLGSSGPGQGGGSRVCPARRWQVDPETGVVVVSGAVSGPKGCTVRIQDAIKKPWPQVAPAVEAATA
ncbi:54S ribosomal protein L9 [Penicillium maclennaniae]|uniref:54S ribosomal protein L9 n=1 Tax=Penicillium maclennaniae TaxID=1343394 RepID=UPI00254091EA|nr:54S ribosomal protein L9 [Penicillium maclennaniae]KAJ5665620.1 54S ribosomal protein L9 [Penicillium maclennaniae]